MKRHDNAALFRYRNDTFQEIFNVFPKALLLLFHHRHGSIHGLHPVYNWNPSPEDEYHLFNGSRPFICSQYITRLVEPSSASLSSCVLVQSNTGIKLYVTHLIPYFAHLRIDSQ